MGGVKLLDLCRQPEATGVLGALPGMVLPPREYTFCVLYVHDTTEHVANCPPNAAGVAPPQSLSGQPLKTKT